MVRHPCRETIWVTEDRSYEFCRRCEGSFELDGPVSWFGQAVEDVGPYCFEGDHTTDAYLVEGEIWGPEHY
jgi:hypothetical protein